MAAHGEAEETAALSIPTLIALGVLGGIGVLVLVWLFVEALVWIARAMEMWL